MARWSNEDRAKVVAVTLERGQRCTMCGSSDHEWEEDPDAYEAVRVICPGCMRREVLSSDQDTPMGKGVSVRLLPRAAAERLAAEQEKKAADGFSRPKRRRD